jgi:hypothetical protein
MSVCKRDAKLVVTHPRPDAERDTHNHQVHAKDVSQCFLLPEEKLDGVRSVLEHIPDVRDRRLGPRGSLPVGRTDQPQGEVDGEAESNRSEACRRGQGCSIPDGEF